MTVAGPGSKLARSQRALALFGQTAIVGSHIVSENANVTNTALFRPSDAADAGGIASIYNEGIAGREATFETEARQPSDFLSRIASERYPLLIAELDGQLVGWAGLAPYSERAAYAGIAECSIYVAGGARGR